MMRYGSVFSGIEAATVAWHRLGWTPAFFSEIEPFCCALLAHHYPSIVNLAPQRVRDEGFALCVQALPSARRNMPRNQVFCGIGVVSVSATIRRI